MKKGLLFVLAFLCVQAAMAAENNADTITVTCRYSDSSQVSSNSEAGDTASTVADEDTDCAVEGDVTCTTTVDCQCPNPDPNGGDLGPDMCDAGGTSSISSVAYTVNWDTNSIQCLAAGCGNGQWNVGFEAGTTGSCCAAGQGESYETSECAAGDPQEYEPCAADATDHCCDNSGDCVYSDACYTSGAAYNLDGSAGNDAVCDTSVWYDCDATAGRCTACGFNFLTGGEGSGFGEYNTGSETECCEDDAGEFYSYKDAYSVAGSLHIAWADQPGDNACCDNAADCVESGSCYSDGVAQAGLNPGGTDNAGFCRAGSSEWQDVDGDQASCEALNLNWSTAGEAGVGEYGDATDGGDGTTECCGDDTDEYMVANNGKENCCTHATDFMYGPSLCGDVTMKRSVYGVVYGQQPDMTYLPLQGVQLEVRWQNFSIANKDITDALGEYNITTIVGDSYFLSVLKAGYDSPTMPLDLSFDLEKDIYLNLTSDCREDCTRWDGIDFRCDKTCDGINNCLYDPSVTSDFLSGTTMKDACDDKLSGWSVAHNSTHLIKCCNQGYREISPEIKAGVEPPDEVRNAQTFYAGSLNYEEDGQLYGLYIVLYDTE